MSSTGPKQEIYARLAELAQAVGHAHRLELLESLAQGERGVEQLAKRCGLTFANTSRHLQILRRARLVEAERRGKQVIYSLAGEAGVIALLKALGALGERNLAEVEQVMDEFYYARDAMEPVTRDELLARMQDGTVTILDVRPQDEFAVGHVPGAINIPLPELELRLGEIAPGREVIAYCRGPFCILSFQAAAALREKGFVVRRLEDGYPEWKASGLPVACVA